MNWISNNITKLNEECRNWILNIFSLLLLIYKLQFSLQGSTVCVAMSAGDQKKLEELERELAGQRLRLSSTEMARWLAATEGDVEEAVARIKGSSEWRQRGKVDGFLHWEPPQVLTMYFPGGLTGFDSEESFIILQRTNKLTIFPILLSVLV